MKKMDKSKRIFEIIKEVFPDDYDIVGKSTTLDLIEIAVSGGRPNPVRSDKGSDFDISESINLMFGLIQVIAAVIHIIEYKKSKNLKIVQQEIKTEVANKIDDDKLDLTKIEEYDELIATILKSSSDE